MLVHTITRPDLKDNFDVIAAVLARYNLLKFSLGAEIGVRYGHFSHHLMGKYPELSMYLVDPYAPYLDLGYEYTIEEQTKIKNEARDRLSPFGTRAIWTYVSSVEAAALCPDHMLDFVFIDAEHTYNSARADISSWYPKVKLGGLISGHDFDMDGVQKAVKEFAGDLAKDIYHVSYPADTWYIFL